MKSAPDRLLAFLTACCLLFSTLLPFFAIYNAQAAQIAASQENPAMQELGDLFGDKVLICTADGFKWVSWQDLAEGKVDNGPHANIQCALCYVAAQGLQPIPAQAIHITAPALQQSSEAMQFSPPVVASPLLLSRGSFGRAPPLQS